MTEASQNTAGAEQTTCQAAGDARVADVGHLVLVDAHVHIYNCFDLALQLRTAFQNFKSYAAMTSPQSEWAGCLLLTESHGFDWFESLYPAIGDPIQHGAAPGWVFHRTQERESIKAFGPNSEKLFIVDGRQIIVAENLEVLALCTREKVPDGQPMVSIVSRIRDAGGLAVVPWGAGKWWFGRGRFLERFMREATDLCLGDNANRPTFLASPRHFALADELRIPVLPGTDPLPMAGEESRTGSFGFALRGVNVSDQPGQAIRDAVLDNEIEIRPYGPLESMPRFFVNQLKINVSKRLPKRSNW